MAAGLHTEMRDAFVGKGVVFDFAAGHPLFVHQHQPLVGEDKIVANQLVGMLNLLARGKNLAKFLLNFAGIDL